MHRNLVPRIGLLTLVAGLGACGSSSGSGSLWPFQEAAPQSAVFDGVPERDGYVTKFTNVNTSGVGVWVGDDGAVDDTLRGFLSFAHPAIPFGATVLSATVFAYQFHVVDEPFTDLGPAVVVDHVDIGADLDPSDYDAPPLAAAIGELSTSPDVGSRWLDVTEAVQADVDAGRATSDFRLAFASDGDFDLENDIVMFTDADDSESNGVVPALLVTWRE